MNNEKRQIRNSISQRRKGTEDTKNREKKEENKKLGMRNKKQEGVKKTRGYKNAVL